LSDNEFPGILIFSRGCDFYSDNEFPGILIFSRGCDFYNIIYSMHGFPTGSNLSQYHNQSKKICEE
jgi:hypothetical protein